MAEVLPDVLTPLAWSFWRDPCEEGLRAAFADAGVLARRDIAPRESIEGRLKGLVVRLAVELVFDEVHRRELGV